MTTAVWGVVVARTGPTGKSRLAPLLRGEERAALTLAMLQDVLATCARAPLAGMLAVVRGEVDDRRLALPVLPDPGRGLNAAVAAGIQATEGRGAAAALVLSSDLPLATAAELEAVVAAGEEAACAVVVACDRLGSGTNALLLRPPGVLMPAYGPHSATRHLAAGRAAGALTRALDLPGLALDVDTLADLAALVRQQPGGATGAALARLGVEERLAAAEGAARWTSPA